MSTIVIVVEGGVIQEVKGDEEGVNVVIIDRDVHDLEPEECIEISGEESYVYSGITAVEVDAEYVKTVVDALNK